jgi:hypothetical protein
MSAPTKRKTAQVWQALEGSDEVELARIAALDDEALDQELRTAGIDPREAADVGKDVLHAASPDAHVPAAATSHPRGVDHLGRAGTSRRTSPRQTPWVAWLAAAAVVVLILTVFAKRREIQAWFGPAHIERDREEAPREPSPQELAAKMRENAYTACGSWLWALCERTLNEAKTLDPAGDGDPRVQEARRAVDKGLGRDAGPDDGKRGPRSPK